MRNLRWARYGIYGLAMTTAALGAPYTGRVLLDGAPAAKIEVRAFASPSPALPECQAGSTRRLFGRCLCPEHEQAFGERLIKGLEVKSAPVATALTAADGTFTLELPDPKARLLARSANGALLAEGHTSPPADLQLQRAEPVRIRIVGTTAGAVAYLSTMEGDLDRLEARDRLFVSSPVAKGTRMLLVAAEGAQTTMLMLANGRPITSFMLGPKEVPEIELWPTLPIRGLVSENGRPVAGVEVIADPDNCATAARTNAKGEFEFSHSNARPYLTPVIARTKGKVARQDVAAGATVELGLRESALIELTVVDEKGAPAAEQWVRLGGPSSEGLITDGVGKLNAQVLAGELTLHVDSPWFVRDPAPLRARGTLKKKVVIERGAVIKGRIIDPHGGATGRQTVDARPVGNDDFFASRSGSSDPSGEFQIEGLKPGKYAVSLFAQREGALEVTAPGQLELTAEVAHVLAGRVVDPTGKPLEGTRVSARLNEGGASWGTETDEKGEFELRVRGPGTYQLTAALGMAKPQVIIAELGPGPGAPLKFELAPAPSIKGKLTDPSGKPVAGQLVEAVSSWMPHLLPLPGADPATVVMIARQSRMYHSAISGADGSFELPVSNPVTIFSGRGSKGADPVPATPGTPVTLVVRQRAVARGRVLDPSGRPVSRYHLNGWEMLDPEGRFELPLFKTGPLELLVSTDWSPDEKRSVEAPEGVMAIEVPPIQLRRGFSVGGAVLDAVTGQPAKSVRIAVEQPGSTAAHQSGVVQPDGSFEIKKLSGDPAELKFEGQEYLPAQVTARAGEPNLKVKLVPRGSLEVTVRKHGEAGKGVTVVLESARGGPRRAFADTDGRAIFSGVDPGPYSAAAVDHGNQGRSKKVVVKPGAKARLELEAP